MEADIHEISRPSVIIRNYEHPPQVDITHGRASVIVSNYGYQKPTKFQRIDENTPSTHQYGGGGLMESNFTFSKLRKGERKIYR